jgi:hypothetical protein
LDSTQTPSNTPVSRLEITIVSTTDGESPKGVVLDIQACTKPATGKTRHFRVRYKTTRVSFLLQVQLEFRQHQVPPLVEQLAQQHHVPPLVEQLAQQHQVPLLVEQEARDLQVQEQRHAHQMQQARRNQRAKPAQHQRQCR